MSAQGWRTLLLSLLVCGALWAMLGIAVVYLVMVA